MTYDSVITALSPLARWKLNETVGSTTAADATGNGWTATQASATCTFGQTPGPIAASSNTALLTDGTAGYFTFGLVTSATTNVTLIAWVKISGATGGPAIKLGTGSNGYCIGIGNAIYDSAGTNVVSLLDGIAWMGSGTPVSTGTWHLLALVLNGTGSASQWLDGASIPGSASGATAPTTGGALAYDLTPSRYFGGQIGEAAIFGSALSGTDLSSLYSAGTAAGGGGGTSRGPFHLPEPLRRQAVIRAASY